MIDKDFIHEVLDTIIKQRWRSVMTAFGVFWGILILTLLIGAGMGLKNGLFESFSAIPSNSVIGITNKTILAHDGFKAGRKWNISVADLEKIKQSFANDIENIAVLNMANDGTPIWVKYGDKSVQAPLAGEQPQSLVGFPQKLVQGRFINEIDMIQKRSVCLIGEELAEKLFDADSPIGKGLEVDGKNYTIVGVGKISSRSINLGFDLSQSIVIPMSLMQASYNQGDEVHKCNFILHDEVDSEEFIAILEPLIRKWHHLHPDDNGAFQLFNMKAHLNQIGAIFGGINFLVWIVGLGTLIAGIIGISNIMLISVKERTKEIAVRTAMGAQPQAIIWQIMCESILLTVVSGMVGMCLGVGLLALLSNALGQGSENFTHPYMPFWTGILSLLILIAGGMFAGYIPAKNALKIELVKALSDV